MTKQAELKAQMQKAKTEFIRPKNYVALLNLGDKKLNGVPTMVFSALYNRLGSSVEQGSDFFDKKEGRFYVIYEYSELAELINMSTKSVGRIIDKLVNAGLVMKKKCFNGVYRLFLTLPDSLKAKFLGLDDNTAEEDAESTDTTPQDTGSSTEQTNCRLNYLNFNYLMPFTNNTINTTAPDFDKISIDSYADTLINQTKVPEDAVQTLVALSGSSYKRMNTVMTHLFHAKKSVKNNAMKQNVKNCGTALLFEVNEFIQQDLNIAMKKIVTRAYKEISNQHDRDKFMFVSFRNFFEKSLTEFLTYGTPENKTQYSDTMVLN